MRNTYQSLKSAVLLIGAVAGMVRPARAQTPVGGSGYLNAYLRTHEIEFGPAHERTALRSVNEFEWKKGDAVHITVADQNPLLWKYETASAGQQTGNRDVAISFAKSLSALTSLLGGKGGGVGNDPYLVENLSFADFMVQLGDLDKRIHALPGWITKSAGTASDIASLKSEVASWDVSTLVETITTEYEKVGRILQRCLDPKASLSTSHELVLACDDPVDQTLLTPERAREFAAARRVAAAALAADLEKAKDSLARLTKKSPRTSATTKAPKKPVPSPVVDTGMGRGTLPPPTNGVPPTPEFNEGHDGQAGGPRTNDDVFAKLTSAAVGPTIREYILTAMALKSDVKERLALIKQFDADVGAINKPWVVKDRAYDAGNRLIDTLKVTPATTYEAYLEPAAKTARADGVKSYVFIQNPYSPVTLSLGAATVVYFPGDRKYGTSPAGTGFTVTESKDDFSSYTIAAVLNITPRAWAQPTFGGAFQIGVSPVKDRLGVYGGITALVEEQFGIGAGIAWQQADRLKKNLVAGQTITSTDLLQTEKRFGAAFYLNINVIKK